MSSSRSRTGPLIKDPNIHAWLLKLYAFFVYTGVFSLGGISARRLSTGSGSRALVHTCRRLQVSQAQGPGGNRAAGDPLEWH